MRGLEQLAHGLREKTATFASEIVNSPSYIPSLRQSGARIIMGREAPPSSGNVSGSTLSGNLLPAGTSLLSQLSFQFFDVESIRREIAVEHDNSNVGHLVSSLGLFAVGRRCYKPTT